MAQSSQKSRTDTNRENASHSTGPRTEAGKDRSRLNALNHGLASAAVLLPYEDPAEYAALKAAFETQHQPGSELEHHLLSRMVDCWWRLQRAYRVEARFLEQREQAIAEKGEGLAGDDALATLFTDREEIARMRLFMRYLGAAERAWNRASADFARAKKERQTTELQADAERQDAVLAEMERYLNAPIGNTTESESEPSPRIRYALINGMRLPVPDDYTGPEVEPPSFLSQRDAA